MTRVRLHLVRHGRPVIDRNRPARAWVLDPSAYDDVWALRDQLPARAAWFTSPEPKAVETAQLLTDAAVGIVDGLREHHRDGAWVDDFAGAVRRAFEHPDTPAAPGWEPLVALRHRLLDAVSPILATHEGDVVLVGHGTAWTLLAASLSAEPPDLERWASMGMPALISLDL